MTGRALALHAPGVFGSRDFHWVRNTAAWVRRWKGDTLRLVLGVTAAIATTAGVLAAIAVDLQGSFSNEAVERQATVLSSSRATTLALRAIGVSDARAMTGPGTTRPQAVSGAPVQ